MALQVQEGKLTLVLQRSYPQWHCQWPEAGYLKLMKKFWPGAGGLEPQPHLEVVSGRWKGSGLWGGRVSGLPLQPSREAEGGQREG